jgi:protein-arginine kinase activator protein McsA
MMDKTIVCDKCGCEGCTVSEILPPEQKISMKEVARLGKSPYNVSSYIHEERDRNWEIRCSACGHTVKYVEYAKRMPVMMHG